MRATAEEKKEKTLADLVEARQGLLAAATSLPPDRQDEIWLGTWSIKDLLAHLAGWDDANLEAAQAVLAGRLPAFYAHHDRDWQTLNARLVAEYKLDDFNALLASVQATRRRLVEFVTAIPAADFLRDRGVRFRGYKVTIARLLQAEASDEQVHAEQIRRFAGHGEG